MAFVAFNKIGRIEVTKTSGVAGLLLAGIQNKITPFVKIGGGQAAHVGQNCGWAYGVGHPLSPQVP